MNKFLLLAVSAFALGMAVPAMAEHHEMHEDEAHAEQAMDEAHDAMDDVCLDEHGEEVPCDDGEAHEEGHDHDHDMDEEHDHDAH